jgi:general secretion pathway protein G
MLTSTDQHDGAGFTMVEIMIVIVILGVLASIVVFAVGGITDRGTTSASAEDAHTLTGAEEAYYARFAAYTGIAGLQTAGVIHGGSSYHDVCLQAPTGTSPALSAVDYYITPQITPGTPRSAGTTCPPDAPPSMRSGYVAEP